MLTSELTRDEVIELLTNGFLPLTNPGELPTRGRPGGLREIGLPYESDPAITKHLAAFLRQAALAMCPGARVLSSTGDHPEMAIPDAVLFNGGFCVPEIARERITEAISHWFGQKDGWRPKVLRNNFMSSAVAAGPRTTVACGAELVCVLRRAVPGATTLGCARNPVARRFACCQRERMRVQPFRSLVVNFRSWPTGQCHLTSRARLSGTMHTETWPTWISARCIGMHRS